MNVTLSRRHALLGLGAVLGQEAFAQSLDPTGGDPLGSMQWPALLKKHMNGASGRLTEDGGSERP